MNVLLRNAIRVAIGGSAAMSLPTVAQQSTSSEGRLEEVVVTATRREASVQDIPYNLSARTGDALERRGIDDIAGVMRTVPGVAYTDPGPRSAGVNSTVFIRGINANSAMGTSNFALGTVAPVSSYIGDTPIFTNLHLADIDRVEVLRGPQGTLYGSGSLGGTVRYLFNRPDFSATEVNVNTSLSSTSGSGDMNWSTKAVINLPLSSQAAFRASVGQVNKAGFIDATSLHVVEDGQPVMVDPTDVANSDPVFTSVEDANDSEMQYARLTLALAPTDNLSADIIYHYQADEATMTQGDNPLTGGLENEFRNLEPYDRNVDLFAIEAEASLGFATLSSSTSWVDNESFGARDATGGYTSAGFWSFYDGSPRENILGRISTDEEKFVQEFRLTSETGEKTDWIVGAYYADESLNIFSADTLQGWAAWHEACGFCAMGFPTANTPSDLNYTYDRTFEVEDMALFGELTYHVTDRWQVTAGFRAFSIEVANAIDQTLPMCGSFCSTDGVDPAGRSGGTLARKFEDEIFRVNTSYDLTESHLLYFNFAEGFRRGGANAVPTVGVFAEDPIFLSYGADQTTNYEVGLKGDFAQWRYSGSVFYIDWDDVQIDTNTPNGGFYAIVNGQTARSQGLELELQGNATESLVVSMTYSYIDAELTSDFAVGTVQGFDGDQLPATPESTWSAGLEYFLDPGMMAGFDVSIALTGSYRGDSTNALNDTSPDFAILEAFSYWTAAVTASKGPLGGRLFVDNLGDTRGVTGTRTVDRNATFGAFDLVARPRTIGMTVSYSFQ